MRKFACSALRLDLEATAEVVDSSGGTCGGVYPGAAKHVLTSGKNGKHLTDS